MHIINNAKEHHDVLNSIICAEDPTDRICITSYDQCCFIDNLCINNLEPSDYFNFLCGNIPLTHIEIEVQNQDFSMYPKIEIMILTPQSVRDGDGTERTAIGVAKVSAMSEEWIGLIVKHDKYGLAFCHSVIDISDASTANTEDVSSVISNLFTGFITNYIGIQMCLLHPEYREIFGSYKTVPISESGKRLSKKAAKRQRIARYVKYHVIDDNKIAHYKHKRKFERKCQAWFVLGHWRQYKDGHRVFIQGYWKGPLREYKRNFDNVRIREVNKCN